MLDFPTVFCDELSCNCSQWYTDTAISDNWDLLTQEQPLQVNNSISKAIVEITNAAAQC